MHDENSGQDHRVDQVSAAQLYDDLTPQSQREEQVKQQNPAAENICPFSIQTAKWKIDKSGYLDCELIVDSSTFLYHTWGCMWYISYNIGRAVLNI